MKRLKKNPYSTVLGVLFIIAGFVLLFVDTLYDLPLWVIGAMWGGGVMLLFAKDKLIEIIGDKFKK